MDDVVNVLPHDDVSVKKVKVTKEVSDNFGLLDSDDLPLNQIDDFSIVRSAAANVQTDREQ